jgi:hypothetical protein
LGATAETYNGPTSLLEMLIAAKNTSSMLEWNIKSFARFISYFSTFQSTDLMEDEIPFIRKENHIRCITF